jgi:site-specific DNA-methyltransferase (adenine-specific)
MNDIKTENLWLMQGDCLERMKEIPDGSVDMVLTDLPFGTTQNKWDSVIPMEELWSEWNRVCKKNAAVVLFGMQPFSSVVVASNLKCFKYDWVWRKPKGTGHLNAKKQPMRDKEDILVFYREQCTYNPQMTKGEPYKNKAGKDHSAKSSMTDSYGDYTNFRYDNDGLRYPKQVIEFGVVERNTVHPTQKPVGLLEYLIKTYTDENQTVLDCTMGSGSTGVAARNTNRKFIGIELDSDYFRIALERIAQ